MANEISTSPADVLNDRERRLSLIGLFAAIFTFAMVFGGMVPWMALVLENRGVSAPLIGLVAAGHPLGVLLAAPLAPRLMRRIGAARATIWGCVLGSVSILLLPLWEGTFGWFVLRFLGGLASAAPWVVTEAWINLAATDRNRGRVVALYTAIMAAGFASGPVLLSLVGAGDYAAFPWFVGLSVVSTFPYLLLRALTPSFDDGEHGSLWPILCAFPALLSAACLSGALDSAFFSFLPIWGLRSGLDADFALALLSIFVAGNILLQFPVGWLADRVGTRPVFLLCGLVSIAAPILVLALALLGWVEQATLGAIVFVWGGAVWGTYSVALVALGHRFAGSALAVANAGIVVAYTGAALAGPPLAGLALDLWDPNGLLVFALIVAIVFTLLVFLRRAEGESDPAAGRNEA